ncbi:hypothetical protein BDQ17DRAFT_1364897 [Cyathus striatus]|nr:hypothetical protein BDQ17DRAFT_1364897 [Cyathus striatus]
MHSFKQYIFLVAVACLATFASAIPIPLSQEVSAPTAGQLINGIGIGGTGNANEDDSTSTNTVTGGNQLLSGNGISNTIASGLSGVKRSERAQQKSAAPPW